MIDRYYYCYYSFRWHEALVFIHLFRWFSFIHLLRLLRSILSRILDILFYLHLHFLFLARMHNIQLAHTNGDYGMPMACCICALIIFLNNFRVKPYVPREPRRDPSHRLYEYGILCISDTARNQTHNLFRPKRASISLGHSDGAHWPTLMETHGMLHLCHIGPHWWSPNTREAVLLFFLFAILSNLLLQILD